MKRHNFHEALQLLEDEGFFSHADIAIQLPGDGLESEEDSGDEDNDNPNHLSGNQLLAGAEVHIDYGDCTSFDTIDDQIDNCENEEIQMTPENSFEAATKSTRQREKRKTKETEPNTSISSDDKEMVTLCGKVPQNVDFKWTEGDLTPPDFQNVPAIRKLDEPMFPLALFELFFDEELVSNIVIGDLLFSLA